MNTYQVDKTTGVIYHTGKVHASHPQLKTHLKEDMLIRADSVDDVRDAIRIVLAACGITNVQDTGGQMSPSGSKTGDYIYASYCNQPTIAMGHYEVSTTINGGHLFIHSDNANLQVDPDGTVYVYRATEICHPSRIPTGTPSIGFTTITVKG